MARPKRLSHLQVRFIVEYLVDLNATQAAIRAGYAVKNASSIGSELLAKPEVAAALEKARATAMVRTEISRDRVLRELGLLAFSDVTHYDVDDNGHVTAAKGAPEGCMRAVSSIKRKLRIDKDGNIEREVELKLWDKPGPLKLAGRHVGLFPSKDTEQLKAEAKALLDEMIEQARQKRATAVQATANAAPADAIAVVPPGGQTS